MGTFLLGSYILDEVGNNFCEFWSGQSVVVRSPKIYIGYLVVLGIFNALNQLSKLLNRDCLLLGRVLENFGYGNDLLAKDGGSFFNIYNLC